MSTIYQRLESAAEIVNAERELAQLTGVNNSASESGKEYINPKTGKPYNKYYINTLIKKGKLPAWYNINRNNLKEINYDKRNR